jgi:carboxypeptidase C (cathepsin A)
VPPEESYSGLIDISTDDLVIKKLSYFFVKSQGNPETDPLVLWSNGGPGCSSFFGAFGEIGPWIFPDHPNE